ncbi:3-keto-5-aminohexanoate cleavage protein [Kineosporia sp. J2-2]|uniref:3-keto-5-aminohexanoate cleavage protein n=1 Tax=Kineosporia corallincola TaxID=2835133 RepID=A0ABS5T9D4_9ACTN|nr:3-keto-5-aminohexanoate cleavage protein [Kineosporia corallincola]MBT0767655.1 3-keto-5-aminohexanoate cleavage protein [Kineosporia corallincola]
MDRTLITVAPTGAELDKAAWPQLPTTPEELLAEAKACEAAGAAMIHVHLRDDEHRPTLDLGRLREAVAALRENTGLIVQLSTGGSVRDPLAARLAVLDAVPEVCSLTCGTVNFGDDVFSNPWPFMAELYHRARTARVVPEFELFDLGQVASMNRLLEEFGPPYGGRVHADLVLGVPGGMPATVPTLVAAVQALPSAVTSWSATGIGRGHLPVLAASLAMGGHLRVGMEDNVFYAPRRPVTGNAELVARAADLAEQLQRPAMGPAQARELLGLSG